MNCMVESICMNNYTILPHFVFYKNYALVRMLWRVIFISVLTGNCVREYKGANIHTVLKHLIQLTHFPQKLFYQEAFLSLHWSRNHLVQSICRNIHTMFLHCIHLHLPQSNMSNYALQSNTCFMHYIFDTWFFYLKRAYKLCEYT
jgi:hypothetical protein